MPTANVPLVDSHCHFDETRFDGDRAAAYAHAQAAGVVAQILPAVSAERWPKLRSVAATYPGLYPAYGLHPMDEPEHRPEHLDQLADWLAREPAVAIGECGLDYSIPGLGPERQVYFFTGQLRLARTHDLPVIIHARRSVDQVIKYIRRYPGVRGVVHSFAGSEEQARRLLALGFLLGFGAPLTFPHATRLQRLVQVLPLTGLLLETDAPYQPGANHPGERNEPAYLPEVLHRIADLRHQDPAEVAAVTTANACHLFRIRLCPPTPSPVPKS